MTRRFGRAPLWLAALTAALALGTAAHAAVITWDGGGGNLNWLTAANWSGDVLPGPGDDVVIDAAGSVTITLAGNASINSLTCADALTCTSGTLTLATTASIDGLVTLNGGSLSGGAWTLPAGLTASTSSSNTLTATTINGNIALSSNASTLHLKNGFTLNGVASLTNFNARIVVDNTLTISAGTFQLDGPSPSSPPQLAVDGTSTLTLAPGVLVEASHGTIGEAVFTNGVSAVVNQGTIREDTAGATLSIVGEGFVNQGTTEATAGTLAVGASTSWSNTGLIRALTTGAVNLDGTVALAGIGDVRNVSGTVRLQSDVAFGGGSLDLNATTGIWTFDGALCTGGTINVAAGATPLFSTSSSNIFDGMTVNGNLALSSNASTLRLKNGFTLNGVASLTAFNARIVVDNTMTISAGTFQLDGPSPSSPPQLAVDGASTLTLAPGVLVEASHGTIGDAIFTGGVSAVVNQGTIREDTAGATLSIVGESFVNQGTVEATAGTLIVQATNWTNSSSMKSLGGTLRLAGSTTLASIAGVTNGGGVVQIAFSVDMANQSLSITPANGIFTFDGGTWKNGTVTIDPAATPLFTSSSSNVFDGMTVNGNIALSSNASTLRLKNGFTLNGVASLTNFNARIVVDNTMTIFAGTFQLDGPSPSSPPQLAVDGASTLTLAPGVLVEASHATIGDAIFTGGVSAVVNQGTIREDTAGATLSIVGEGFVNQGTTEATAGTLAVGASTSWSNTGLIRALTTGAVNLDGSVALADLGDVRNVSGTVRLQSNLAFAGGDIDLNATTGIWTFDGAVCTGGTINVASGHPLFSTSSSNIFDGMTVNGTPPSARTPPPSASRTASPLNGVASLYQLLNARIIVDNTMTIFAAPSARRSSRAARLARAVDGRVHLTSPLASWSRPATARSARPSSSTARSAVVNQGTIREDTAGATLSIVGEGFVNRGRPKRPPAPSPSAPAPRGRTPGSSALTTSAVNLDGTVALAGIGDVRNVSGTVAFSRTSPSEAAARPQRHHRHLDLRRAVCTGGTINVAAGATPLFSTSSSNIFDGMTVNGNLALSSNASTLRLKNGFTLNGVANLTNFNARIIVDNTMTIFAGTFQLDGPSPSSPPQLAVDGASTLTLAPGVLVEASYGTIGEAVFNNGVSAVVSQATIRSDLGGGTLTIAGESFTNNGVVEAINGSTTVAMAASNLNASGVLTGGIWRALNSTIRFGGLAAGTPIKTLAAECKINGRNGKILDLAKLESIAPTGILRIEDGATLAAAPVSGMLTQNGFLSLVGSGKLTVAGGFTHANTAITNVLVGAANAIEINATGAVSLTGILQVGNAPGFSPTAGDQVTIVKGSSLTGTFDTLTSCDLVDLFYTPTSVLYVYGEDTGITGDLNGDGLVGPADLALLLGAWGTCSDFCCNADLDLDKQVGPSDLALLLGGWG